LLPPLSSLRLRPFSTTSTRYPLYYDLILYRPSPPSSSPPPPPPPRPPPRTPMPTPTPAMDRSKRRYYRKRRRRLYGASDDDDGGGGGEVELRPEVVDFPRLHAREQELYFHDAFAFPWEKDKHYRMVYRLEKKYFPDQSLDKAFVDPSDDPPPPPRKKTASKKVDSGGGGCGGDGDGERDERGLVFFEEEEAGERKDGVDLKSKATAERKVEEFFKCLKKVPSEKKNVFRGGGIKEDEQEEGEPYLASRRTGLPPRWDGPSGTVVLVDKPKGWTSFTVCGKLRRLVKVQKVGHAGTLDPMATGLLIVCVGKATKLVERYQGMLKGYSGVFRLGEATSTWDADSPVIQREPWEHIKDEDIKKSAASFLGEIWQVPPMFSAIKVGGEKMYEKARRGEMIELSPRRISIYQFDIERSLEDRQNLIFRVTCSKGTYIRSLCADFGKALGSCAHLIALRRDLIGEYSVNDAWSFEELQEKITKGYL
ncbi:tRNA pseudouridine synthase B, partial [Ananas comosus]